jgi:hypothetical protein
MRAQIQISETIDAPSIILQNFTNLLNVVSEHHDESKIQLKISKLRRNVTCQQLDWMHKLTSDKVRDHSLIAGDKLNVIIAVAQYGLFLAAFAHQFVAVIL